MKLEDTTGATLTNLRFADDIVLVASSLQTLRRMMEDLSAEAKKVGLEIHMGKTKILTNKQGRRKNKASYADVGSAKVEILSAGESTKYLGRDLNLDGKMIKS